jgi:ubiquinone/menaquinone biosynthesis C-methylase UbiE
MSRCSDKKCATMWADPCPKPEVVEKFYHNYYTHSEKDAEQSSTQSFGRQMPQSIRIKVMLRKALSMISGSPTRFQPELRYLKGKRPGAVLDIGCGNGDFLIEAKAAGWWVVGQEFDSFSAEIAKSRTGAEVRVGGLHQVAFDANSFDAITMSNVFEHVPNPIETLEEIKRILKPSGVLVSISPNPNSYLHQKYREHWRGLEIPRHLFLFPPSAKKALFERTGFTEIKSFSTLGAFELMEQASAEIRAKDRLNLPKLEAVSRAQRAGIFASILVGHEIGEWTVVVARKP